MIAVAKITAKGQTTIPQAIREAMRDGPGDVIAWEVERGGMANVRRLAPRDTEYLRFLAKTLSEWESSLDEEAYRDL